MTVACKPQNLKDYNNAAEKADMLVNQYWKMFVENYKQNIAETKTRISKKQAKQELFRSLIILYGLTVQGLNKTS